MSERRPRVMQSFKPPRPTTNPYITMLDRALAAESRFEHLNFSWREALLTRVDVLHLHWPEVMLEGSTAWKRWGKRVLMRVLLAKHRLTGGAIVRTVHNVELPQDVDSATRRILVAIEERTDHRVVLNDSTPTADPSATTLIPHGHYRDWFASYEHADRVAGQIGYFGLIRRYKGIETLLAVYERARDQDDTLSLRVGGRPSSPALADTVSAASARVPRITATLRFLEDAELVEIATSSQLVVLPYRFMHNSGGALASLSLDRPVLLPRNDVNEALGVEIGPGWVHLYDGELTADRLRTAMDATRDVTGSPDLSRREWSAVGQRHAAAYRKAVLHRKHATNRNSRG
ncbi:glycosyl transferase [Microbacterium sp. P03]|uniref:glycosyl transferase n=1 Tax=Microbacterium sp. P03 TaxID=3366946 RepID=UPI003745139B